MAYGHILLAIHPHSPVIYQYSQRLRCKGGHILPSSYLLIDRQFANVHDVSWGTKGDNKVSTDLGVVKTSKNTNEVEVVVPTAEKDINALYEDAIHMLSTKPPKEVQVVDEKTRQDDYYRTFRTKYA